MTVYSQKKEIPRKTLSSWPDLGILQEARTEIRWFYFSTALSLLIFILIFGQIWLQNVPMEQKRFGEVTTPGFSYPHQEKRTSK